MQSSHMCLFELFNVCELFAVSVFPNPFKHTSVFEDNLSLTVKFAIQEIANIDSAIVFLPSKLAMTVYHIIFKGPD